MPQNQNQNPTSKDKTSQTWIEQVKQNQPILVSS